MTPDGALPPGSTIGILGGGQLGRMLALAAAEMGLSCHIYAPPGDNPAAEVAKAATIAAWDDEAALSAFAAAVDVVTYEFENVPEATARFLAERVALRPGVGALVVAQDRLAEKTMATGLGIPVARYLPVESVADLVAALRRVAPPAILKTRRLGYDGKGQVRIMDVTAADAAWQAIGGVPAVLEQMVPLTTEVSALVARGIDGSVRTFDIAENRHENGILATTTVPARVAPEIARKAAGIGEQLVTALDYVGLLAVELFVVGTGEGARLLFNEVAPRVHNSGHWTTDGCLVSQFEQHMRAVAGWPLGSPDRHSDVVMTNLLGTAVDNWEAIAAEPGARLHLYNKAEARPGRKMGHVNRIQRRRG